MSRHVLAHPVVSGIVLILILCASGTLALPDRSDVIGTIGLVLATSAAGVVFLRGATRLEGRERLAWSGIGMAMLFAALGVVVVATLHSSGASIPAFGPLDSFFIFAYALICISIVAMPHAEGRWSVRVLALVDGLVGAVAFSTVAWVWFLSEYLDRLQFAPLGQRVIAMAYPMLDVALLICLLMLWIRRSSFRFDRRLLLIAIGLVFQTVADLSFAANGVGETFAETEPIYALNIAAGIFFLTTASIVDQRPSLREFADRPTRWVTLIAPYGAAAVVVGGLVWQALDRETGHVPLLAVSTVAVVLLTFARQSVSIREYRDRVDLDRQNLVSSISHELRTPLTSMSGMLEMLRARDSHLTLDERDEFLDTVTDQARYMSRIVSDLILLARERDDTLHVQPSSFDLDRLVRAAVTHVDAPVEVEIDAQSAIVGVDGDRIQQATANMVGNAFKYGGGRVLLRAYRAEEVVIEVHDDGPGVPTKFELLVWNRFERGPRSLDSRVPGSGIGLAVVAEVAKAHGGRAGYRRSEILGGACFFLVPPADVGPSSEVAHKGSAAPLIIPG